MTMAADVEEVEREFRRYFMTGPVLEDWQAWAGLFTDDATYFDHFYGRFTGPAEITRFLEGTMGAAPHVYSVLVWYLIDGERVAYKVLNRADNPKPGGQPIDFPSYQFIEYAGGGKWRSEEDVWLLPEMKGLAARYAAAEAAHPQTLEQKLRRDDWGSWVDWARPEPGHTAAPSWLGKTGFRPFSGIQDIHFGIRSH
ncbi:nuclear transport factor 2 family protein [Mycobacterium paraintracellulare]|uniref:nuclear transport factor 2 family protein n=1 Tax=Mycobacterium paraintracellulare TaxID=1138383 RepID=UPI001EEE3AE4|nr:nuclear transport factor 2 family protein [Mycobacterium paraintracellulare]WVL48081.1 nuclear transport factor 2 family protein [Mycobacterium paraintracellulare]